MKPAESASKSCIGDVVEVDNVGQTHVSNRLQHHETLYEAVICAAIEALITLKPLGHWKSDDNVTEMVDVAGEIANKAVARSFQDLPHFRQHT